MINETTNELERINNLLKERSEIVIKLAKQARLDRYKNKKWQTRDGEDILISEMGTNHIINTINMLTRNIDDEYYKGDEEFDKSYIKLFNTELKKRGKLIIQDDSDIPNIIIID